LNTTFDSNIAALLAHELDPAFAARAALILRHVQPAGAGRILDVGCGRGFYARAIAALYPQAAVVGVDYSNDYLTAASEHTRGMAVQFARADARSLPFASGEFDAIVCSEVLEHIVEDGAVLIELNRVLRDGGLLLISVPNRQYPFMWDPLNWVLERVFGTHVPAHIWWLAGIWADHVRLYTAPELSGRVRSAGFTLDNLWLTTPRCLPFAHFLLYGIGKNIIERGFLPSCNRFDQEQGNSRLLRWARSLLFAFDDPPTARTDETFSVGIVLKARKQGCAAKIAQD
jgi:ubiquinone/menaquinone biosynthesis C-methylase UbiE